VLVDGVSLGFAGLGATIIATAAWLWPGVE
jgi:hypothetical protein